MSEKESLCIAALFGAFVCSYMFAHVFTAGFRATSAKTFYDVVAADFSWNKFAVFQLATFKIFCIASKGVQILAPCNYTRTVVLFIASVVTISCLFSAGYSFSDVPTVEKFRLEVSLGYVIAAFTGLYYWIYFDSAMFGMVIRPHKYLLFVVHVCLMPLIVIGMHASSVSIYIGPGGYLNTYIAYGIMGVTLFLFVATTQVNTPSIEPLSKQSNQSSLFLKHFVVNCFGTLLLNSALFAPFVIFANESDPLQRSNVLYCLFAGVELGGLTACIMLNPIARSRVRDMVAISCAVTIPLLMMLWKEVTSNEAILTIAFVYGACVYYLDVWQLQQTFSLAVRSLQSNGAKGATVENSKHVLFIHEICGAIGPFIISTFIDDSFPVVTNVLIILFSLFAVIVIIKVLMNDRERLKS